MTGRDAAYLKHLLDAICHIEDFSGTITSATELRDHPLERAGIERMLPVHSEHHRGPATILPGSVIVPKTGRIHVLNRIHPEETDV